MLATAVLILIAALALAGLRQRSRRLRREVHDRYMARRWTEYRLWCNLHGKIPRTPEQQRIIGGRIAGAFPPVPPPCLSGCVCNGEWQKERGLHDIARRYGLPKTLLRP